MDTIVSNVDLNYLAQQSSGKLNMILAEMTALLNDNEKKVSLIENQTWFQRMCKTITGKNKVTQQEIQNNHDKINAYVSQAMAGLFEQQSIDRQIIMSLGNQMNVMYAEQIQLKQMLGAFVVKLNEKIESIDNFHMLNTEIEQGVYTEEKPIISICEILSQMDKQCVQDERKTDILQRSMAAQGILRDEQILLIDYLNGITEIPMDKAGEIYIELSSLRTSFMANIIIHIMESYHFLPDMARKMKNKSAIIQNIVESEQLDPSIMISSMDIYNDFIDTKRAMFDGFGPITIDQKSLENSNLILESNEAKASCNGHLAITDETTELKEAENLFLTCKMDEAFEKFKNMAENGVGRAMYFLSEYYSQGHDYGFGSVIQDKDEAWKWREKGRDAGDPLAAINTAYLYPYESNERYDVISKYLDMIKQLSQNGDVIAQFELGSLYKYSHPKLGALSETQ